MHYINFSFLYAQRQLKVPSVVYSWTEYDFGINIFILYIVPLHLI